MKKTFSLAIVMAAFLSVSAQNVQLHYDFGHLYENLASRPSVTTTVELYKPDKWGNTFFFTDLDYQRDGVAGAYWEISREFNLSKNRQWAMHVEYDGGLSSDEDTWQATRFQHAVLLGGAWNWAGRDFSKTFSVQLMYKYYFKSRHYGAHPYSSFQLTEVWSTVFCGRLCTFSGYCDLWYNPDVNGRLTVQSEPQLWFNFNAVKGWDGINLSVGSEVEISNNFIYDDKGRNNKFYAVPTFAVKWSF